MTINWLWNGIKVDGKLYRCSYGIGPYTIASNIPNGTVCVYAKDYRGFPNLEEAGIETINESDPQTDYFEKDRFYVYPDSFHYNNARNAYNKMIEHIDRKLEKRYSK